MSETKWAGPNPDRGDGQSIWVSPRLQPLPLDNPALYARLTSAINLHRGSKGRNGPLPQALKAMASTDARSATFVDQIEPNPEDLARLRLDQLYFDIYTAAFRGGEILGQILL